MCRGERLGIIPLLFISFTKRHRITALWIQLCASPINEVTRMGQNQRTMGSYVLAYPIYNTIICKCSLWFSFPKHGIAFRNEPLRMNRDWWGLVLLSELMLRELIPKRGVAWTSGIYQCQVGNEWKTRNWRMLSLLLCYMVATWAWTRSSTISVHTKLKSFYRVQLFKVSNFHTIKSIQVLYVW